MRELRKSSGRGPLLWLDGPPPTANETDFPPFTPAWLFNEVADGCTGLLLKLLRCICINLVKEFFMQIIARYCKSISSVVGCLGGYWAPEALLFCVALPESSTSVAPVVAEISIA